MKRAAFLLLTALAAGFFLAAQSQPESDNEPLDMKSYTCAVHLDLIELEDGRSDIVTVWAHGYYNGMRGVDEKAAPESWISVEAFSEQLLEICRSGPKTLFIHAVKQAAQARPEASRP